MALLYRAMIRDADGAPAIGNSARELGIRLVLDIEVDDESMVEPLTGGMSVSHEVEYLPAHRRPRDHGGTGPDPLWVIDEESLVEGLVRRDDHELEGHAFVEPAWRMRLDDYEDLLALTRDDWRIHA